MAITIDTAADYLRALPDEHPARATILESWSRCFAARLSASASPSFRRVDPEELAQRQQRSERLVAAAEPHLHWALSVLRGTTHAAYVTDADGIVLRSMGAKPVLEQFRLTPGHDWSERQMGTNGAGTALATGRPVVVAGPEHYITAFHDCTCTAAPIRDEGGALLGALDISSSVHEAVLGRISMVATLGSRIEEALRAHPTAAEPSGQVDAELASRVSERLAEARAQLTELLLKAGLLARDGWRITEELRSTVEGTVWVFRPIHLRLPSPPDLEVRVTVDFEGRLV